MHLLLQHRILATDKGSYPQCCVLVSDFPSVESGTGKSPLLKVYSPPLCAFPRKTEKSRLSGKLSMPSVFSDLTPSCWQETFWMIVLPSIPVPSGHLSWWHTDFLLTLWLTKKSECSWRCDTTWSCWLGLRKSKVIANSLPALRFDPDWNWGRGLAPIFQFFQMHRVNGQQCQEIVFEVYYTRLLFLNPAVVFGRSGCYKSAPLDRDSQLAGDGQTLAV